MIHIIKGSFPKVSYTQTWDIKIYKIEVVGQNAQKMQKSQFLEGSWPRMWFVGLINTTKVTLLAYNYTTIWREIFKGSNFCSFHG